jgi:acetyl esterase/lipase
MSAVLDFEESAVAVDVRELEVGGAQGPLAARLYTAGAPPKRDTLVVFFHGGGFVSGDLQEADEFLRYMAQCSQERAVLASNYTLATVSPFPAAVEDAHAVLLWATKHKAKLGWSGK